MKTSVLHEPETKNTASRKNDYDYSKINYLYLNVDATTKCQLGCSYCYFGKKGRTMMNPGKVFSAVTKILKAMGPQINQLRVHYMGGEPLIGWDKIMELNSLIRTFSTKNNISFSWSLTSNLIDLDEKKSAIMIKEKADIHCSIDGPEFIQNHNRPFKNGRGSFEIVDKKIPLALKITPDDLLRVTVTPYSARYLPEITEYLIVKGGLNIGLFPALNEKWEKEDLTAWAQGIKQAFQIAQDRKVFLRTLLLPQKRGNEKLSYCGAGKSLWSLDVGGTLYGCHRLSNEKEHALINASMATVEEIQEAIKHKFSGATETALPERCQNCVALYHCSGGCWAENVQETGDPHLPSDTSCLIKKLTFESIKEFLDNAPTDGICIFSCNTGCDGCDSCNGCDNYRKAYCCDDVGCGPGDNS